MARPREFDILVVLDAAARVFWELGFEGASIERLTKAMGLGRASIYGAFKDKADIHLQSLGRYHATVIKTLLDPLFDPEVPGLDAVRRTFEAQRTRLVSPDTPPGCMAVLAAQDVHGDNSPVGRLLENVLNDFELGFYQALRRAQISRELSIEHDPRELGRALAQVMYAMASTARIRQDERSLKEVEDVWLRLLLP